MTVITVLPTKLETHYNTENKTLIQTEVDNRLASGAVMRAGRRTPHPHHRQQLSRMDDSEYRGRCAVIARIVRTQG